MDMNIDPHLRERMTQAMLNCLITNVALYEEILHCQDKAEEANAAAMCPLPYTAASGKPVVHGARCVVDRIEAYWISRRDAAVRLLHRGTESDAWCFKNGIDPICLGNLNRRPIQDEGVKS